MKAPLIALIFLATASTTFAEPQKAPARFSAMSSSVALQVVKTECLSGAEVNTDATMPVGSAIPFTDGLIGGAMLSHPEDRLILELKMDKTRIVANGAPACPVGDILRITFKK